MSTSADVVVLGGGVAGAAAGRALALLGHDVTLITRDRHQAVEGVSERTMTALRAAGLDAAADAVVGPGSRSIRWAAGESAEGREFMAERNVFDRALRADAANGGVMIQLGTVLECRPEGAGWSVRTRDGIVHCRAVVEARGRSVRGELHRGPGLLALSRRYVLRRRGGPGTCVFPFSDGWCWLASMPDGSAWFQVASSPREVRRNGGPASLLNAAAARIPELSAILDGAVAKGPFFARAATARYSLQAERPGLVRAGDTAIAMDPLSGHGIYEALAATRSVVAGVHTYLDAGRWPVVKRFLNERSGAVWRRVVATAAHYYELQAEHDGSAFWRAAAAGYREAEIAAGSATPAASPAVELRPVLNGSHIELRRVVVTAAQPRGIWRVGSLELAGLVDYCRRRPAAGRDEVAGHFNEDPEQILRAMSWLSAQGLVSPAGNGEQMAKAAG